MGFWLRQVEVNALSVNGLPRRTNNCVESFLNSLRIKFNVVQPNLSPYSPEQKCQHNYIYNEHNHDKCDEQVLTRQKISDAVKRKAVNDISAQPSKIVHNEFKNGDISTLTTNNSCPKFFTQIFMIHGYYKDSYVLLVFLLLPTKESNIYVKAFQNIINYCTSLSLTFRPSEINVDFENRIHNAIKQVWTDVRIKGCRFHLGQSWRRAIQRLGLSKKYKSDSEKSKYLNYFFGLPFLNETDVIQCFTEDLIAIKPCDDQKIYNFTDYILNNYIHNDVAQFPPMFGVIFQQ
ncbi:MULE domain-containing protein [Aphis craccivora]|uniref:MULE domain-containing protein n=1 Tax=Aphis craccivora TaxID=307492 RepID=A0A6G0YEP4_APHCR|nr:MULE domain-containing protein [Aphis craccivora]